MQLLLKLPFPGIGVKIICTNLPVIWENYKENAYNKFT